MTRNPAPPSNQSAPPGRPRLLTVGDGINDDAFGPVEWALLLSTAMIWGSSFLLIDIGLRSFTPGVVTVARVALGTLALALVPKARRGVDRADLPRVALLGVLWIGIPMILFPVAQQWIDSSVAGMLNAAVPLSTAAWAAALLRRRPNRRQVLGLLIGFVGVLAVTLPEVDSGIGESAGLGAGLLGITLVLVAVVMYGLSANVAVPLQQRYGALPVLLRAQLVALVVVTPYGLLTAGGSSWSWGSAIAMVPLGVLGTGLAFVLMVTLVGRVGGPRGAVGIYFTPIVAIALGVTLNSERLHPSAAIGCLLIIVGAWITSRRVAPATATTPRSQA